MVITFKAEHLTRIFLQVYCYTFPFFNQNNRIMTTLDDEHLIVDPASVSPWPIAIRYGLIGGLIYCIYTLIGNMSGLTTGAFGMVASTLSGLLVFGIAICLIVFPVKQHRDKELGGYITIGRVITIGLVVTIISMLISNIFNYVYMNFIDPGFVDNMLANMEEMIGEYVPEEQLEEILIQSRKGFEPATMIKNTLIMTGVFGLIISGIVGLIMKKDPPRM